MIPELDFTCLLCAESGLRSELDDQSLIATLRYLYPDTSDPVLMQEHALRDHNVPKSDMRGMKRYDTDDGSVHVWSLPDKRLWLKAIARV